MVPGSREFYYQKGRTKEDVDLHDPILEDGDEKAMTKAAIKRAMDRGASRELAEKLYKE